MESFKGENMERENPASDIEIEKKDGASAERKSIGEALEDYSFEPKESFDPQELKKLAKLEGYTTGKKEKSEWGSEKETERCELRKTLEATLEKKKPNEVSDFWKRNRNEYGDNFGRGRQEQADHSFQLLKHGILNEIIATKILRKLPGFKVAISSSRADIKNKIDLFCFSEKIILAVQVKSKSRKDMARQREDVLEEVGVQTSDPKKNEFIAGCLQLENELGLKDRGIEVKKIWFIIPSEDKKGDGGEYDTFLDKEVREKIEGITRHSAG